MTGCAVSSSTPSSYSDRMDSHREAAQQRQRAAANEPPATQQAPRFAPETRVEFAPSVGADRPPNTEDPTPPWDRRSGSRSRSKAQPPPQAMPSAVNVKPLLEETSHTFGDGQQHFVIHELLGQGGFGSVYRCSAAAAPSRTSTPGSTAGPTPAANDSAGGMEYAVKVIDAQRIAMLLGSTIEVVVPRLLREAEVLVALGHHPNIVFLHDVFFSKQSCKVYLLYELMRGGDLFAAIVRRRRPMKEAEARRIMRQLAEAVLYGHRRGIAHRDIKLENCLLEDERSLNVKICDYGQAKMIGRNSTAKTLTCSAAYTAPDVQFAVSESRTYDAMKADAFALGVLLYGLLCSALPNAAKGTAYQSHSMWAKLSPGARDLVQSLLAPESNERLSVEQALEHSWLRGHNSGSRTPEDEALVRRVSPWDSSVHEQELKTILAVHQLVIALQRERGNCVGSAGGERFQWHVRFTDQRYAETMERLSIHDDHPWLQLKSNLTNAYHTLSALRRPATEAMCQNPVPLGAVDRVVDAYSRVVSQIIEGLAFVLQAACPPSHRSASNSVRHKLLMLTAEQLGRERALFCGHLRHPGRLSEPATARRVHEVIGARKLLLGTAHFNGESPINTPLSDVTGQSTGSTDAVPSCVVAGELGILPALGLTDMPLLEPQELAQLEEAEDRALAPPTSGSAPKIAEWYQLITNLIDKVHQHLALNIVDHFPRKEPTDMTTTPTSEKATPQNI